jgi:hypothetical protein
VNCLGFVEFVVGMCVYVCFFLRGEDVCTCVGWAWKRRVCGDAYEGGGGGILSFTWC